MNCLCLNTKIRNRLFILSSVIVGLLHSDSVLSIVQKKATLGDILTKYVKIRRGPLCLDFGKRSCC